MWEQDNNNNVAPSWSLDRGVRGYFSATPAGYSRPGTPTSAAPASPRMKAAGGSHGHGHNPPGQAVVRVLLAILASASWMLVSSLLIILNKYLMVDLKFK